MIRPAREDEIAALVAAYDWLFAPPGSQPRQWDRMPRGSACSR